MKVKLLRNLGSDLVNQLAADGVKVPDQMEGSEIDVKEERAKELFGLGVAEPVAVRADPAAKADAAIKGGRQEGTWDSSTAREQIEAESQKTQQQNQQDAAQGQQPKGDAGNAGRPAGDAPKGKK